MSEAPESKKMGLWMSTSLVVGNMIGAGIFLIPAALAAFGGISILGWIASAAGALLIARVFSKLSTIAGNKSGGPYTYTQLAFGDFMGFLIAWGYWISVWITNAAISIAFVSAMSVLIPPLGENPVWAVATGLGAIWFLSWVNSRGVRDTGKMQLVTTLLKIVPILIVIIGGFLFFNPDNFIPFNASGEGPFVAVATTATLTLFAFLGIESASVPAGDIKDPEKTIPRATMLGTGFVTLIYILSTIVVMGMIPMDQLAVSPSPFADAMGIISGEWGRNLVAAGAAISAFGALNGWILLVGQIPKATAGDKLFPQFFGRVNKQGVPVRGILVGSVLSSVLMLMNYSEGLVEQFRFMVLLGTFCALVPYLFTASAYLILMTKNQLSNKLWWPVILIGGGAFLYSIWGLYGAGESSVFYGFILMMAGIPFYVWIKWKNRKEQ
jgi:APA family basic amino acid/polyamine antiporter